MHVDGRGSSPTEGALTSVTVTDAAGDVVGERLVSYPGRPEGEPSRRYDLVRGLRLPAGRYTVAVEILPCTGSCPEPATADPGDLRTGLRELCELVVDVAAGEVRELIVTTPEGTATADCSLDG